MAFFTDHPKTFFEACAIVRRILPTDKEPETHEIVRSAYVRGTGRPMKRAELLLRMRDPFPAEAGQTLVIMAHQRAEGRPLQHLTGYQQFLGHEYEVGPDVLIPRPETEILVSEAVAELQALGITPGIGLEIGLGSGIISIELLSEMSTLQMFASELLPAARARASTNAKSILGDRAESRLRILPVSQALDVFGPFSPPRERADFLISNPPYLASEAEAEADVIRHEPREALFSQSEDPSFFYKQIAEHAHEYLKPGAPVFLEIPHERAQQIGALFIAQGWGVRLVPDLTGRERVLIARQETQNG